MKILCRSIYLLFFISFPLFGNDINLIAQSKTWKLLTQYESLSPKIVLNNFIANLNDPSAFLKANDNSHPQCLHPARFEYLIRRNIISHRAVNCIGLNKWLSNIQISKIKVVLASQFISNPASIMGHTFFKFTDETSPEYTSTAINYAARIPDTTSPLEYAYSGLFGGFMGVFSKSPYYEKVQEYSNIERRDLWEFEVDITREEIVFILKRIWELKFGTKLNYLFATENCSYMLVELINLVRPALPLTENFSTYVIPHETVKVLNKFNLIKSIKFVPSARKELIYNYNELSDNDKEELLQVIVGKKNKKLSRAQLDTYLKYFALERYKNGGKLSLEQTKKRDDALIQRSKEMASNNISLTEPQTPLDSHDPYRLSLYHLKTKSSSNGIIFNPGFHSFMDYSAGFLENSQFDFFTFDINFQKELTLRELTLTHIMNLTSFTKIDYTTSWEFFIKNINKDHCQFMSCEFSQIYFNIGFASQFNYLGIGVDYHVFSTEESILYPTINHKFFYQNSSLKLHLNSFLTYKLEMYHELQIRKYRVLKHLDLEFNLTINDQVDQYLVKAIYDY